MSDGRSQTDGGRQQISTLLAPTNRTFAALSSTVLDGRMSPGYGKTGRMGRTHQCSPFSHIRATSCNRERYNLWLPIRTNADASLDDFKAMFKMKLRTAPSLPRSVSPRSQPQASTDRRSYLYNEQPHRTYQATLQESWSHQ